MTTIDEFPDDDAFWVLLWVDGFWLSHQATHSPSVSVVLRRLSISTPRELDRMTLKEVAAWLRRPAKDLGSDGPVPEAPQIETRIRVHAGTIPLLSIGAVFHRRKRIGYLPSASANIMVTANDTQPGPPLRDVLPPPSGWKPDIPYRLLNPSEFDLPRDLHGGSRCLVIPDDRTNTDYIIPRFEIFRRFFGPHTELAKAFMRGTWSHTAKNVLYLGSMESGLKTCITESGDYHVILQTLVPDQYARWLAILYFDPFARACADEIFARSWQETIGKTLHTPAACAARFPFQASPQDPIKLRVRGWYLWTPGFLEAKGGRRKFLVRSILSCSEPAYLPNIRMERFNSGLLGGDHVHIDKNAPYSHRKSAEPAALDTTITAQHDDNVRETAALIDADSFFWHGAKPIPKLEKDSTKGFTKGPAVSQAKDTLTTVSTGEDTYEEGLPAPGRISTMVRDTVQRFQHLEDVFTSLVERTVLLGHSPEPPHLSWQVVECNGVDCWTFLTQKQRETGHWPKKSWVMLKNANRRTGDHAKGTPRSAYIARLVGHLATGYWIEIESKPAESFTSALLVDVASPDVQTVLQAAMACIAEVKGRNLRDHLVAALAEYPCRVYVVKHDYESHADSRVSVASIHNAVVRAGLSPGEQARAGR